MENIQSMNFARIVRQPVERVQTKPPTQPPSMFNVRIWVWAVKFVLRCVLMGKSSRAAPSQCMLGSLATRPQH